MVKRKDLPDRMWPQIVITIICNLGTMSYGLHLGWLSPLQLKFAFNTTNPLGPEAGAFSREEISWIGSIPTFPLMIGPYIYAVFLQLVGRKWTLFIATIPNIVAILMLIFAKSLAVIYAARTVAGLAACIFLLVPVYTNEIVEDKIRGILGVLTGIFINIGVVLAYIFGSYTSYLTFQLVIMFFPVVFLIFFYFIPETPQYLLSVNKKEEAIAAIQLLRGGTYAKCEETANQITKMIEASRNTEKVNPWTIVKQKTFLRGIFIIMGLFFIQQFCGSLAVTSYSQSIYVEAGSSLDSQISSIIMSLLQLGGSIASALTVDKLGRRVLLLISNSVLSLALIVLTIYLYIKSSTLILGWLPILCLCVYVFFYSYGSGSVAYVMLPELFPPQSKPYASSICGCWLSLLSFLIIRFYLPVSNAITIAGTFTIFAAVGVFGIVFTFFFVVETKNKTLGEIMVKLGGDKNAVTSGAQNGKVPPQESFKKKSIV